MEAATAHPKSFNPWPVAIIGFFAVAIVGCAAFVVFCSLHPAELVTPDYYEQEVRYQAQLDSLRRAQQPGAKPCVVYDPARHLVTISFLGVPEAANLSGSVHLYRPATASADRRFPIQLNHEGVQEIDVRKLAPGLWKVRLNWQIGGESHLAEEKVVIAAG